MAMVCVTAGRECDGCQECIEREIIETCSICHEDIYAGEDYLDIEGEVLHRDCLEEWAEQFRVFSE